MFDEMSASTHTYFVDPEAGAELSRLMHQDRLLTQALEGPLPERQDMEKMEMLLDVACGPGGWVLEVARQYRHLQVVGVDISQTAIRYASMQAQERRLRNASFRVMNVLEPMDFPDHTFDLVNARLLVAFLPRTFWPAFLAECTRILRPGGILRLTETEINFTTSPALNAVTGYFTRASKQAGLGFSLDGAQFNITPMLAPLLRQSGYRDIGRSAHVIDFSAGEPAHDGFLENIVAGCRLAQPFLIKLDVATQEELDRLCRASREEMMADDFHALWFILTVWGTTPASW